MAEDAKDNRVKITLNIDKDVKEQISVMCESVGISMNTAINLLMVHSIRTGEFDFRIPMKSYFEYGVVKLDTGQ